MSILSVSLQNGDQNRFGIILAMTVAALTISCIFVALRIYTSFFVTKSVSWDDLISCLALLGVIVGAGLDILRIHYGFGRHQYPLTAHQIQEFKKYSYGNWIQTFLTLMFTKVAVCLLLLRLAPSKKIIRPVQGLIAFLVASNVILVTFWILQCTPPAAVWNATKQDTARCFTLSEIELIVLVQAVISLTSDLFLAASPILFVRSTTWAFRANSPLYCLIGLGLLTFICCLVRTILTRQLDHPDQTWLSVDNYLWRTAETTLGLVAACLPTLAPLWRLARNTINARRKRNTETAENAFILNRPRRGQRNTSTTFPLPSQKQLPAPPPPPPSPPNARSTSNAQTPTYRDSDSIVRGTSYSFMDGSDTGYSRALSSEAGYSLVVNEHLELARRVMEFQPVVQREEERSAERPRLRVDLEWEGELGAERSCWGEEVWEGISRLELEPPRVTFRDV